MYLCKYFFFFFFFYIIYLQLLLEYHCRYLFLAGAIRYQLCFKKEDRFYTALPLYHTAGGAMSIGQAILYSSCVVIRRKFSASAYFNDIVKYNCTVSANRVVAYTHIYRTYYLVPT